MGKGKKTGKILFSVAGFALGAANPAWFGIDKAMKGAWFAAGMYGMSIASTIWSVVAKPNAFGNLDGDYSQDDYSKFSTTTNDISQDAVIPVIYGTRKWGGLQVWHNPYNGERYLQKDVIICEGGIKGVYNVCANEELIKMILISVSIISSIRMRQSIAVAILYISRLAVRQIHMR